MTTTSKTSKKATVKTTSAKATSAVKASKAKAKAVEADEDEEEETVRVRVFKMLARNPKGLTCPELRERLALSAAPSFIKHECLAPKSPKLSRGYVDGRRAVVYSITAAGRQALKDGTLDEDRAPTSCGRSEILTRQEVTLIAKPKTKAKKPAKAAGKPAKAPKAKK